MTTGPTRALIVRKPRSLATKSAGSPRALPKTRSETERRWVIPRSVRLALICLSHRKRKNMPNPNATTLPIEFLRDIFEAMSGSNAGKIDDADLAALPSPCQVSVSFGISHDQHDIEHALETVWPYPESTQHAALFAVVRGNGVEMARHKAIFGELSRKVQDTSALFYSSSKSNTLSPGTASISLFAIAHAPA